jgi:hypothetical protein
MLTVKRTLFASFMAMLLVSSLLVPASFACHGNRGGNGRHHRNVSYSNDYNGNDYYQQNRGYYPQRNHWRNNYGQSNAGRIVKGGLIGAGVGAGTAVVLNKKILPTTLIGAAVGAGIQAVRYGF